MNQIQEEDWANDSWAWHTGMKSDHNYEDEDKKEKDDQNPKNDHTD